ERGRGRCPRLRGEGRRQANGWIEVGARPPARTGAVQLMRLFSREKESGRRDAREQEQEQASAGVRPDSRPMSEVMSAGPSGLPADASENQTRVKVVVHRLDGGLEDGESDARSITADGFPVYSPNDPTRSRFVPARDLKYIVLGSL